jgi:hypothetical protein
VKAPELARIDKALEDGIPAGELLPAKAWKIPLDGIQRVQYKQNRTSRHLAGELARHDCSSPAASKLAG